MSNFYKVPTLGGKLVILNCLILAAAIYFGEIGYPKICVAGFYLAAWPLAFLFRVADSVAHIVLASVLFGVYSLLWGYAIAWVALHVREFAKADRVDVVR